MSTGNLEPEEEVVESSKVDEEEEEEGSSTLLTEDVNKNEDQDNEEDEEDFKEHVEDDKIDGDNEEEATIQGEKEHKVRIIRAPPPIQVQTTIQIAYETPSAITTISELSSSQHYDKSQQKYLKLLWKRPH